MRAPALLCGPEVSGAPRQHLPHEAVHIVCMYSWLRSHSPDSAHATQFESWSSQPGRAAFGCLAGFWPFVRRGYLPWWRFGWFQIH